MPGIYDLTAYQRYSVDPPFGPHAGSSLYWTVVELASDGSYRYVQHALGSLVAVSGRFSTRGTEFLQETDCPDNQNDDSRPYTATSTTLLFWDTLGYEYVLTRRQG